MTSVVALYRGKERQCWRRRTQQVVLEWVGRHFVGVSRLRFHLFTPRFFLRGGARASLAGASYNRSKSVTSAHALLRAYLKDYFLGEDWVDVLLEDSIRFQVTGALSVGGVEREHGEMAWIEPDQIESNYPALHELLVDLHALPFELNLKQPGLRLSSPIRGERAV